MTTITENFSIGKVDYIEQGNKEIGNSARYNVGVRKVLIGCLKCGETWFANDRAGLRQAMGAFYIECPKCRTTEQVPPPTFGL